MKQISKYQKESFHRKLTSILVIAVLVAVVFAVGFVVKLLDFTLPVAHRNISNNKNQNQSSKNITISGNVVCLSLKKGKTDNSNPNKCKVGVVDSKGQKYAVSGGSNLNLYGEANSNGVEVSGEFIPASEDETYDIVGTIKRS